MSISLFKVAGTQTFPPLQVPCSTSTLSSQTCILLSLYLLWQNLTETLLFCLYPVVVPIIINNQIIQVWNIILGAVRVLTLYSLHFLTCWTMKEHVLCHLKKNPMLLNLVYICCHLWGCFLVFSIASIEILPAWLSSVVKHLSL